MADRTDIVGIGAVEAHTVDVDAVNGFDAVDGVGAIDGTNVVEKMLATGVEIDRLM